jgi:endonuclease G
LSPDDKKVQKAFEKALKTYGHRPDVTGVDIGYKYSGGERTDEITVRIHVREKIPLSLLQAAEVLPSEIDGVPIDVIQGNYTPSSNGILMLAARRHRRGTIQPGISISHHLGTAGTIGALVFDRTDGRACILSNKHVLAEAILAEVGDQILQPGRIDGGRRDVDAIARLRRLYLGVRGDAAIAVLNDTRQTDRRQYESNAEITQTRRAAVGDKVTKSGRTTGVTEGDVDGIGRFKVMYGTQERRIDGFKIKVENRANPENLEITSAGDSGAIWYDPDTADGLGLHYAGEGDSAPTAEYSLACHLDAVLDELSVSLSPVAEQDFIALPEPSPEPEPPPDPAPTGGPTLADLLGGAGANEETLSNLDHDEACAAALREHGLSVTTGPGGALEITIDAQKTKGRLRISFEPE